MNKDRDLIGAGIGLAFGIFECFISGRWQWKWFPCDPLETGGKYLFIKMYFVNISCLNQILISAYQIPPVTCKFTVDNEVLGVYYNDKPLNVTGHLNIWENEKTVSFQPEGDGYGEIKVKGVDHSPDNHCTNGGLVMLCKSSDGHGPWHNFKSDIRYWRSKDNYELCENDGGMVSDYFLATANENFLAPLVNAGATKIWTAKKDNTLIGSPMPGKKHY